MYVFACMYVCTDVNREKLYEHIQSVYLSRCGICGEMFNARHKAKSCFFTHLVYITDGEGEN